MLSRQLKEFFLGRNRNAIFQCPLLKTMAGARHALALLWLLCFWCQIEALHPTHRVQEQGAELIELPTYGREAGGLVWVVQLSDLHFSSYRPMRAVSFKKLLPPLLALINPSLVLITGDLTDGKSKNLATMQQDESEWVQYRDTIDWVISQSKLPEYMFFDIRGNHDKFGVPEIGGRFDYFSKYSITAQQNRSSSVQSVILLVL